MLICPLGLIIFGMIACTISFFARTVNIKDKLRDMQIKTRALIIRRHLYSNTSLIVSMLCPDEGKIDALAKGARRAVKKPMFENHLDLMCLGEALIQTAPAGGLARLYEFAADDDYRGIRKDSSRLERAYVILDLASEFTRPGLESARIFDLTTRALSLLERTNSPGTALLTFWTAIIAESGFSPVGGVCESCGEPLVKSKSFFVSAHVSGVLCGNCRPEGAGVATMDNATFTLWKNLESPELKRLELLKLGERQMKSLTRVLAPYTIAMLEKVPRTFTRLGKLSG
ncbi:MAG: DNA repair protein RecO [Planctomycetes bacterium]|nr:DNA repair protein RecO [Planctomycetota bacterium]